jgi:hypothetical protein
MPSHEEQRSRRGLRSVVCSRAATMTAANMLAMNLFAMNMTAMKRLGIGGICLLGLAAACSAQSAGYPKDLPGEWSGTLTLGEQAQSLQFELHDQGGKLAGAFVAGEERFPFAGVDLTGDEVTFRLANGGRLHARIERVRAAAGDSFPALRGDYTVPDGQGGTRRFWIEAVHMAAVVTHDPDEPEAATGVWGAWRYQLTGSDGSGKVVEQGTLTLTKAKGEREQDFAELAPDKRTKTVLRGVGSKFPQMPSDAQMEAWERMGKKPTKADIKTVEGIIFSRFDGTQALMLAADLEPDGSLAGRWFANGEQFSFRATRAPR